jgi:hypothetical protein
MKGFKHYSEYEDNIIKSNYKTTRNGTIGSLIGRSSDSVKHRMKKLNLKRSPIEVSTMQKLPNSGQFKKGNTPHNTSKTGNGTIVKRKDRCGRVYKYIRTSLNVWELLQRVEYAKTYGSIPKGYVIYFKDGNSLNCKISNLECISNAELLRRNHHDIPEPIKKTKKLINKLSIAIKNQEKNG